MKSEIKQRITQLNDGEIPNGYKKTEFGIFPCDWVTDKQLNDLAFLNNKKYDPETDNGNPICIELEHIKNYSGYIEGHSFGKNQCSVKSVFNEGDILFGKLRPYLGKFYYAKSSGVCSTEIWVIKNKSSITSSFLYRIITSKKFIDDCCNSAFGTKMPRASWDYLAKIKYAYPKTEDEQIGISEILMKWDKAIELQEQTIEKLYTKRDAIIQRIIKKKDGWHQVRLTTVLRERNEYATKDDGYPHASLTKLGVGLKADRYNRDFLVKSDDKKYKVTHLNDVCYNPANLKFGVICINKCEFDAIFSPIYVTYEVSPDYNIDFVGAILCSNDFVRYIRKYEEGTVYERQAVKSADFVKGVIWVPKTKDEQDQIAKIISKVNDQIQKEVEFCELLRQQRKVLQKYLLNGIVRVNA